MSRKLTQILVGIAISLILAGGEVQAQNSDELFADDFETGSLSDEDWFFTPPWMVQTDENGNGILAIGPGFEQNTYNGLRVNAESEWRNYEARFRLRLIDGRGTVNILARLVAFSGYSIGLSPQGAGLGKSRGPDYENATPTARATMLADGEWHDVFVSVDGQNLLVTIDDVEILNYIDSKEPFLLGTFGFQVFDESQPQIDNLIITALPDTVIGPFETASGELDSRQLLNLIQFHLQQGNNIISGNRTQSFDGVQCWWGGCPIDTSYAIEQFDEALQLIRTHKRDERLEGTTEQPLILAAEYHALYGLGVAYMQVNHDPHSLYQIDRSRLQQAAQEDIQRFGKGLSFLDQAITFSERNPEFDLPAEWAYLHKALLLDQVAAPAANIIIDDLSLTIDSYFAHSNRTTLIESAGTSAADIFRANRNNTMLHLSLNIAAHARFGLASTYTITDGGRTQLEWYELMAEAYREASSISVGDALLANYGNGLFNYSQSIYSGEIEANFEAVEPLLEEQIALGSRFGEDHAQGAFYRGTAKSQLAWIRQDRVLAAEAIPDLTLALRALEAEHGATSGLNFFVFNQLLYGDHTLGRAYYLVERYDLAARHLASARNRTRTIRGMPLFPSTRLGIENEWLLGESLLKLGQSAQAIDAFDEADSSLYDSYPEVLRGQSEAYQGNGQFDKSLESLAERLVHYEEQLAEQNTPPAEGEASVAPELIAETQANIIDTLLRTATPLLVLNRPEEAIINLNEALNLAIELVDSTLLTEVYLNLADTHLQLGDEDSAIPNYVAAADFAQQGGNALASQRARALLGLGRIRLNRGLLDDAALDLRAALGAAQTVRDLESQVAIFTAQGDLELLREEPNLAAAEDNFQSALDAAEQSGNTRLGIDALTSLGGSQAQTETPLAAIPTYHEALARAEIVNDRDAIAQIHGHLGEVSAQNGREEVADRHFADAIDVVELTQRGIQSETLQSQFAANYAWIYAEYIDLLIGQDRSEEAFVIAERARARAFLDQLAAGPIDFREDAAAGLLEAESDLRQQIDATRALVLEAQGADIPDREHIQELSQSLQSLETDYASLLNRLQAESPILATLADVDVPTLADIQASLEPDTALVSYYTTPRRSFAFIVTRDGFKATTLRITQDELREAIAIFRADEQQTTGLDRLYNALFGPLARDMEVSNLIIVPHNVLHYLPFAALQIDDERYLGDEYAISYLPSASTLLLLPDAPEVAGDLLALGNPIAEGQRSLPFAEQEVNSVVAITGGEAVLGDDATEALLWERAPESGVLYLAAHGTFNPGNPAFSALHLTPGDQENGRLEAHEIYRLDLTQSTELVVLSACQTAVGRLSAGDDFAGLNRAFLYAGAPAVVASLWSVDDAATSIFVEAFFTAREQGVSNSEALQTAQKMVRNYEDEAGNTPYTAPFYWAAFILTGRS